MGRETKDHPTMQFKTRVKAFGFVTRADLPLQLSQDGELRLRFWELPNTGLLQRPPA